MDIIDDNYNYVDQSGFDDFETTFSKRLNR